MVIPIPEFYARVFATKDFLPAHPKTLSGLFLPAHKSLASHLLAQQTRAKEETLVPR